MENAEKIYLLILGRIFGHQWTEEVVHCEYLQKRNCDDETLAQF
jgi:hypothetical protein